MTFQAIRERAAKAGRTRLIAMSTPMLDLDLFVAPEVDLDGRFSATCAETGDDLALNGWLFDLHDAADDRAELVARYGFDWREHQTACPLIGRPRIPRPSY